MALAVQEEREKTQLKGMKSSVTIHSNEMGDEATNPCEFPFEIIEVVAEYLNELDCSNFRAVNSFFRLKAPIPLRLRIFLQSPIFVFFEKENVLSFVPPRHGIEHKCSINLPEDIQEDCEFCYSKDGWLLVGGKISNWFFNPFTQEVKQLAYGPKEIRNVPCVGFSHSPISESVVVKPHQPHHISNNMMVHVTRLGKKEWKESYFKDCNFCFDNVGPCFHNGAFYYLSHKGKLGILRVVGEEDMLWEECEKPHPPCDTNYYKCFLVECNGSLLSVFEGAFGNWVRVFKLNESKMTWMQVESLGDHMLFVGNQSFSAVADIPEMKNKIYFPRFYAQNMVFYSLATKNYHTFENSEVVEFHCMTEPFNTTWIQPRWC